MMHTIIGLFLISLGIWGVFDEWYYVIDFVKGSFSFLLIIGGLFGIFAGVMKPLLSESKETTTTDITDSET